MDIRPTILSLFTGYGGLELGLARALGGARTVCMVEREAFAAANLVAQMQAGAVAPAPIWTDVSTFDGKPWRGRVDILTGGPPCQPFSTAGKRRHTDDERWIWADVARIIGEVRPGVVFLENVPGLRKRGLGVMLRDLAALGFDGAEWGCFRASDAGAPHRRTRLFLLAYASGLGQPEQRTAHDEHRGDASGHQPDGRNEAMANAMCAGPQGRQPQALQRAGRGHQGGAAAELCAASFPPGPDDAEGWRRWLGAGGPEPGVRGGADGAPNRVDRIRLLGNGVVPAQAELAFRELTNRALGAQGE